MAFDTNNIRNAVLIGHAKSGKTTLAETMLFESGAISRMGTVEEGNTVSDFNEIEKQRGSSVFCSLMHVNWDKIKINLIDTPGVDDFIGEALAGLKVADTAVMVINAKEGVEVQNEILRDYIEDLHTPTLFVINQMDHESADYEKSLEQIIDRFGTKAIPFQFPYKVKEGFYRIVDALRMTMYVFGENGGKPTKEAIPEDVLERAKEMHNAIVEAAAEESEGLMEKYFEQGTLDEEDLTAGLQLAMGKQSIFPVFCVSATQNMGSGRVMGFIRDVCPSPLQRSEKKLESGATIKTNKDNPTSLFIFKTLTQPQMGKMSFFKVYSGKVKDGDNLVNAYTQETERINRVFIINGKDREEAKELVAGDLGVTVKLKDTETNHTLNEEGVNHKIRQMKFPPSKIRMAVVTPNKAEFEKLTNALHIIQEEDPTFIVEYNSELKQTIIHGQGRLHLDEIQERIKIMYGIDMELERPKIPYRETISKNAEAHYRHRKQSGGAGQFAEIKMRLEPWTEDLELPQDVNVRKEELIDLSWGGKLHFVWGIVGGNIDNRFIGAIKKGIMQKMEEGPLTGSYCQDIRVVVMDGKMHAVDSNDMAFQLAASAAFTEAFKQADPKLLEPLYQLNVLCDSEVMGDIMTDLQIRRAMISGIDNVGHYREISALVPIKEMYGFSQSLRSITQGKAKFERHFSEYQLMPYEEQANLLKAN